MTDLASSTPARKIPILIPILVMIPLIGLGFYFGPNLLDSTPPTLTVSGLEEDKQYRGPLTLNIAAIDEKPGLGTLTVQIDDTPPKLLNLAEGETPLWTLQTTAFADGRHTVSIRAIDRSLS